jgi:hypothetical protein
MFEPTPSAVITHERKRRCSLANFHMARLDLILAAIALTALLAVFAWTAFR